MTFIGPLFISLLLRFVSGVPFPEKKYKENPEWMQYCRETNVFCLWFYKIDNSNVEAETPKENTQKTIESKQSEEKENKQGNNIEVLKTEDNPIN